MNSKSFRRNNRTQWHLRKILSFTIDIDFIFISHCWLYKSRRRNDHHWKEKKTREVSVICMRFPPMKIQSNEVASCPFPIALNVFRGERKKYFPLFLFSVLFVITKLMAARDRQGFPIRIATGRSNMPCEYPYNEQ